MKWKPFSNKTTFDTEVGDTDNENCKNPTSKNEFKCSTCQSVFISQANLDKHNIFVHVYEGRDS